jgi:pyridoxine 4-dehydrogenase
MTASTATLSTCYRTIVCLSWTGRIRGRIRCCSQNRYNLVDRDSEDVLDHCERHSIGFIPWFPLASGSLAKPGSILNSIAKAHNAAPSQIALAWVLKRSPIMLPIPGTSKVAHLEENVVAVDIQLSDGEFAALDRAGREQRAS